ncbi:hypothetical protein ABFS82_06G118900 [Erythranthe guttata]|uniref:uncharacterized protein At3g06530 n=1 Tax=Erythranthe guttata TaxID=4155 RepID=UPI00064DAF2F|nr:PREDICTED: uncharacterized protein At3g06530 [Erythranthe guttata]|eukprot:XP_012847839.1 PREDICTED: uncharacterized protein At3g06530 [Erythranthe guttata]
MARASISSQLQIIKTALNASTDAEPGKRRPLTRPSILFDAKAAADIDIDTIFGIALSGLETLITTEERFRNYKNDLFSSQSKELDRELAGQEENKRINSSISSYLSLLSGYLESHSALKTVEYLIRRYKVHVHNVEDLILCALPYHDTHVFVQIVQLIDTGNSRWKFLDGVKVSGARLPREVIVQQCIRDMGVLEAICNYATPVKKIQPSKHVTGFCTAVIFEVLGLVTVDSDIVKMILQYVSSALQPGARGQNQKAGALMIISLLSQKSALAPNVVKSLMLSVADTARAEAKERGDLQWLRMSFMTIISIVRLQSVELIPKKTVDVLNDIRDISGILSGLAKDFNIDNFIAVFLNSLLEYSASDEQCRRTLLSIIETVPMKLNVDRVVSRLLTTSMKICQGNVDSVSSESVSGGKQILASISQKYPNESRSAIYRFVKETKIQSKKINSTYDLLCKIIDEHLGSSPQMLDPKISFALEHSEAGIRKSAVLGLDIADVLREKTAGSAKFAAIQDALLRRLYDDDLNVVLAVLNLKNLSDILTAPSLIEAIHNVLQRCVELLLSSSSTNTSSRNNAALLCLQQVITNFKDEELYSKTLATMIFPLLLIQSKTERSNMKALELAKELKCPLYKNLVLLPLSEKAEKGSEKGSKKQLDQKLERISSANSVNISELAKTFSSSPKEYMPWLIECCNTHELSKTLFFLVLLESLVMLKMDVGQFYTIFDSCFPILKNEWEKLESLGISAEQSGKRIVDVDCEGNLDVDCKGTIDVDCKGILNDLLDTDIKDLNAEILSCLFWRLLKAFIAIAPADLSPDMKEKWLSTLQGLFLFACHSKDAFSKHLKYLFMKCKNPLSRIMLKLLTEEGIPNTAQIETLHSLSHICSQLDESSTLQLLENFPSILVPLSSDNQNIRLAAMSCIEELSPLWSRISKNGKSGVSLHFLGEMLFLIMQQKKMILSDRNVLASLFTSLLSSSSESLLVQQAIGKRFNESTKKDILNFMLDHALGLPAHAKLKILSLIKGAGSKLMSSGVESLLNDLLENRRQHYLKDGKLCPKLSQSEVDILCLLLEICTKANSSDEARDFGKFIVEALRLNGAEETAVLEPCMTILRNLSSSIYGSMKPETQELIFRNLLILYRCPNGGIQNSSRDTVLRISLNCSIVEKILDPIVDPNTSSVASAHGKKQKRSVKNQDRNQCDDATQGRENPLLFLSAFLDVLLMKKDIVNRTSLIGPLYKLLRLTFENEEWMLKAHKASSGSSQSVSDFTAHIQQTLLLTLEDICVSIGNDIAHKDVGHKYDLQLLVEHACSSDDVVTSNYAFSLITALVKIVPDEVCARTSDILTTMGKSTVTQLDSQSQRVFEGLISAIIPCWLSRTNDNDTDKLLQIFVEVLPQVAERRGLSIIQHILRTLGEAESLGSLLFLLFQSLISRQSELSLLNKQWEYEFAVLLSEQYSCTIWLSSLILVLKKIGTSIEDKFKQMQVAMQFVADKLRDPEISYKLQLKEDMHDIQNMVGELMEQVVYHLQLVDSNKKHSLKENIRAVLRTLTKGLPPSTYFNVIKELINHGDSDMKKKALGLLSETVKDLGTGAKLKKKGSVSSIRSSWQQLDEVSLKSFEKLCSSIKKLLDDAREDISSTSLELAAVSALEVLANRFPSHDDVYSKCLKSVCKRICSDNSALSSHCLRATGALVNALGPKALEELPSVMKCVLEKFPAETKKTVDSAIGSSSSVDSLFMSVLLTLEAVVNKLAGFLNPYLTRILQLVVLHPLSFSSSDPKLKLKADVVRKLITEKIPVRLLLQPVLDMYPKSIGLGESSVSVVFEMLGNLVSSMDRASISVYHAKVFGLCLEALDLRHQNLDSIQNIDVVEQNVINVVVTLTMKLTGSTFRLLLIKTIEWSDSNVEGDESTPGKSDSRAISFYSLVNKLAESQTSLFVPYFKDLLDGCVRGLDDAGDTKTTLTQKKKKAKLNDTTTDKDGALSIQVWHRRALILSALHKCFLYDSGSSKLLNYSEFEDLRKALVSQLVVEPPVSLKKHANVPSVEEVDDSLVACIGQMAVTADSDLFWKPLNHEVLMQTRSEKIRARVLGLRIVKYLVEKLKEEYLVLLPETIRFLDEVLEDSELPVKSLAQDIVREIETMSGESIRQYL